MTISEQGARDAASRVECIELVDMTEDVRSIVMWATCELTRREAERAELGKTITAEWLESLHSEKKWKSHGLRRYWFTGRDQCSLTVLETRDEWYLELTGATKAVTQNQLLDLLRALKGGAS